MFARTDRLLLRPSWPEDARDLHEAVCDENIVRNLARAPWPYQIEDARDFAARPQDEKFPSFLVFRRTNGAPELIGSCGLGEDEDGSTEIGYWFKKSAWGLGFATEASRAIIEIAQASGHRQLTAGHFTDNPASGNVLRKLGFRPTGQIVQRFSLGRGRKSACATYALDLTDAGEDQAPVMTGIIQNTIRATIQRLAA